VDESECRGYLTKKMIAVRGCESAEVLVIGLSVEARAGLVAESDCKVCLVAL